MANPSYRYPKDQGAKLFLEAIAPYAAAYEDPHFCFLASYRAGEWRIVRGALYLIAAPNAVPSRFVRTTTVAAGACQLSALGLTVRDVLERIAGGRISLPDIELVFDHPPQPNVLVAKRFNESQDQGRTVTMTYLGQEDRGYFDRPDDDWQVKAGNPPYDLLAEIAGEFGVSPIPEYGSLFEVRAVHPLVVDYDSPVKDKKAVPMVRMSAALDPDKVSLGLRLMSPDATERRFLSGKDITWAPDTQNPRVLVGRGEVDVSQEAVIGCYASYDGVAMHYGWLRDPATFPNANRAVLEVFDPNMSKVSRLLSNRPGRDKGAQNEDLEDAMAHILWVMGFGVSQIGRNKVTSDAVDIIARTPKGHYAIIEATTGPMKAEGKLANLQRRSSEARRALATSGHTSVRVVPVFITTLPVADVEHDKKDAELSGVRVLTWEDIHDAVEARTLIAADPDTLLDEMVSYLEDLHRPNTATTIVAPADA